MKNLNKKYIAPLLILALVISTTVGVYAYLVSMEITAQVTISGFDSILYDFSAYSNYQDQIVLTNVITTDGFSNAFGLILTSHNLDPTILTISIPDLPEGGTASAQLVYTSWRVEPTELYIMSEPISIELDVPITINPDKIDWVPFEALWTGAPTAGQESENSAILEFTFDMSGVIDGIWGEIPVTITVDLSS